MGYYHSQGCKNGLYAVDDMLNNPDALIEALQAYKAAEIEKAKKQRKTIRYFTEDLKEVGHEDSLW